MMSLSVGLLEAGVRPTASTRPANTGFILDARLHGPCLRAPVHTTRDGPCTRAVFMGAGKHYTMNTDLGHGCQK